MLEIRGKALRTNRLGKEQKAAFAGDPGSKALLSAASAMDQVQLQLHSEKVTEIV